MGEAQRIAHLLRLFAFVHLCTIWRSVKTDAHKQILSTGCVQNSPPRPPLPDRKLQSGGDLSPLREAPCSVQTKRGTVMVCLHRCGHPRQWASAASSEYCAGHWRDSSVSDAPR